MGCYGRFGLALGKIAKLAFMDGMPECTVAPPRRWAWCKNSINKNLAADGSHGGVLYLGQRAVSETIATAVCGRPLSARSSATVGSSWTQIDRK